MTDPDSIYAGETVGPGQPPSLDDVSSVRVILAVVGAVIIVGVFRVYDTIREFLG